MTRYPNVCCTASRVVSELVYDGPEIIRLNNALSPPLITLMIAAATTVAMTGTQMGRSLFGRWCSDSVPV